MRNAYLHMGTQEIRAPQLPSNRPAVMRRTERILLLIGLTLMAFWGGARIYRSAASRAAIARFQAKVAGTPAHRLSPVIDPAVGSRVDFRLWSTKRIVAYIESLAQTGDTPIAVLRIPTVDLRAPVFEGTDELTLNRGLGRIAGTARIGEPGNLGIAGHRDGFFRVLKDIHTGDSVLLDLGGKTQEYVVKQMQIVNPDDVQVLAPTGTPTLTLVTCFPFYFVGSAPQRYIVTAWAKTSSWSD